MNMASVSNIEAYILVLCDIVEKSGSIRASLSLNKALWDSYSSSLEAPFRGLPFLLDSSLLPLSLRLNCQTLRGPRNRAVSHESMCLCSLLVQVVFGQITCLSRVILPSIAIHSAFISLFNCDLCSATDFLC